MDLQKTVLNAETRVLRGYFQTQHCLPDLVTMKTALLHS
jgi:hypothetical protein